MIEAVKNKVGKSIYMELSRANSFIEQGKEPEMTPVLSMLYDKFLGEVPEKVTKDNFEKLIRAISKANTYGEFIEKVKREFNVSFEKAGIISLLYSAGAFVPKTKLFEKYNDSFSEVSPITSAILEELITELKEEGLITEVLNGIALTAETSERMEKLYRASKQTLELKAMLIDYDDPKSRETIMKGLQIFFEEFPDSLGKRKYIQYINSALANSQSKIIPVDYPDIEEVLPNFAIELIENPEESIDILNDALSNTVMSNFNSDNAHKFSVGIRNLPKSVMPRDAQRGENVARLIQVEGIVTRVSEVRPFLEKAVFVCKDCGNEMVRIQFPYMPITKPTKCDACGSRNLFIDHRASKYDDVQYIKIQDFPDKLRGGEMPRSITVILKGADMIDKVKAGDKVKVTGILQIDESRKIQKPLPQVILLASWIESENKDYYDVEITPDDEQRIIEFSKRDDALEVLSESIAPKIKGYKKEKLGITLALFGGVPKVYRGTRKRGDIHILLFGDYATAKSKLMEAALSIAPRGLLVTSAHSSKAGIGAAAIRDEHTGEYVLEAGAFVIADNGTVGIDELDKMPKDVRDSLHEILESQQISVNKAGINAVLNTRASCIATANPKAGKYNKYKPFVDQTNIPPTLLSRFDLIFILTDDPDEKRDREIAEIILDDSKVDAKEVLDRDFMIKYIAYARQNVKPRMTKDAIKMIADYYVDIRKRAKANSDPADGYVKVPITARQLEAIKRLAEAAARARLRDVVTVEDAKIAIDLMEYSLSKLIVDEEGDFDITIIESGKSVSNIKKLDMLIEVIKYLISEKKNEYGAAYDDIVELMKEKGVSEADTKKLLEQLHQVGEIYSPRQGYYKISLE